MSRRKQVTANRFDVLAQDDLQREIDQIKHEREELADLIRANMTCNICYEIIAGKIVQCLNGHLHCMGCVERIGSCSVCRIPMSDSVRCLAMEKLRSQTRFFCENKGCDESSIGYDAHLSHKKVCPHNKCPSDGCSYIGTLEDVRTHIQQVCQYKIIECPAIDEEKNKLCSQKIRACDFIDHCKSCGHKYEKQSKLAIDRFETFVCGDLFWRNEARVVTIVIVEDEVFCVHVVRNQEMITSEIKLSYNTSTSCNAEWYYMHFKMSDETEITAKFSVKLDRKMSVCIPERHFEKCDFRLWFGWK